jgi:hypothetical protein
MQLMKIFNPQWLDENELHENILCGVVKVFSSPDNFLIACKGVADEISRVCQHI